MSSIVKVDTIQENTSANGITVDGLNIKDSKLVTANSVITSNITDDNVTYGKIQNVSATNRILGRDSANAGIIEEITPANLRTMLNVADGANVGGGKVLQLVNGLTTTAVTHVSDGGQVNTGLTATITPTASNSKIMVFISQSNKVERGAVQLAYSLRLFRGSTEVEKWSEVCAEDVENADRFYGSNHCYNFLDTPNSTSQLVYKTTGQIGSSGGGRTVRFQDSSAPSTMTLMEIGA